MGRIWLYSRRMNTLLVMLGGAIGAAARYHLGGATLRAFGPAFPWDTLIANVSGGLLMGVLMARVGDNTAWRLFLGVGVLGGFTTFSAFSFETIALVERGAAPTAIAYILASVLGALVALWAGLSIARAVA